MTRERVKSVAYWVTTIFGPSSFVIGGVLHLRLSPDVVETLHHLGYPTYFAFILGLGNLLGAIICTVPGVPRLKEWAYAGFFLNLTAAAFSRYAAGDGAVDIIAPLVFLALLMSSWALRPAGRRLASPSAVHPTQSPDVSHGILRVESGIV